MLAIRCKPRWPGAVATVRVGSPSRARARCLGTATTTETAPAAETAEGPGRDAVEEGAGQGSFRIRKLLLPTKNSRIPYDPRVYAPKPMSYVDLIRRTTSYLRWKTRQAISAPRTELLRGGRSSQDADGASSVRPAGPSPSPDSSLEQILDRSAYTLDLISEQMRPILSAVSEDISSRLVPKGNTNDPATLRTHHLGRWYADSQWLQYEHRHITTYLRNVAADTRRVRKYVASVSINLANEALRVQMAASRRAIEDYRSVFEAFAHTIIRELKVARLDERWHRVWTLERRLALTASLFLPSRPLAFEYHKLLPSENRRINEISMARMAEWDDSYKPLYIEDAQSRSQMNLVNRYRAVFNDEIRERPWYGESRICVVRSPTSNEREYIVLRLDKGSIPSPLWPGAWRPVWRRIWEPESEEATHGMDRWTILTPPKREGQTAVDPKSKGLEQPSLDTRANPDVPEAWYGALLSDR